MASTSARRCVRRLLLSSLLMAGLLVPARAQSANQAAMVRDEIGLLTYIGGGSPLSDAEQQEAAEIVARSMKTEPQRWIQLDQNGQRVLAHLAQNDPMYAAYMREGSRANAEFPPPGNAAALEESRIIRAHDPAIAVDPVHHQVVTEQTLLAIRKADTLVAARLNTQPPGEAFYAAEREQMRQQFARWDDKTRDAYAHAARNEVATEIFLTRFVSAQKIGPYFAQVRQQIVARPDGQSEALTNYAVAQLLPAGYKLYQQRAGQGGAAGAEALQLRWMMMKGAQQAVMCSPGAGAGLCSALP